MKTIVYEQKLPEITAIAAADIQTLTMPVDTYIQEASYLYHWAKADLEKLFDAGLDPALVEDIPFRCDALSEAQSIWHNVMRSQQEAQQRWSAESPEAFELRDELLHAMRYAYRNDASLLGRVRDVAEGNSDADMIQDLNDLAIIGRENPQPLEQIGFDIANLELAATVSSQMSTLRGAASANRDSDSAKKQVRDQAYTHLKVAVDEVRACGQYVFWKDPQRRKGYASEYARRVHTRTEDSTQPIGTATAANS